MPEDKNRSAITLDIIEHTGIDEPMIERLVRAFYGKIREDNLIGPIFAAKIDDWEPHLRKMCDFWSSVMLATGRYRGYPMRAHLPLPIGDGHFDRWLDLFAMTAREVCPVEAAALFIDRAENIAQNFEVGVAAARGEAKAPRPRCHRENE